MKIILDLDGTILDKNGVISSNLLNYFHNKASSLDVSICTGRFSDSLVEIIEKLNLDDSYHICDGGGRIIDNLGTTIWANEIDLQVIKLAYEIQNQFDIDIVLSDKGADVDSVAQIIVRRVKDDYLEPIIQTFPKDLVNIQKVWYWEGHGHTLSITSKKIDKGYALRKLAKIKKFSLNDSVMIADGDNDIPCFKICGTKIAMGNSSENLRELANYLVDTVDNDGVIQAIELLSNS